MARERTLDEALDMFEAWEQAAQAVAPRPSLAQVLRDTERNTGVRLRPRGKAERTRPRGPRPRKLVKLADTGT